MLWLLILSIPVACVSWTIAETEVFRNVRESFKEWAKNRGGMVRQKLAYLPTCYYCTSHYVAIFFLLMRPTNIAEDIRGYVISWFTVVAFSAVWLTIYNMLRASLRWIKAEADRAEEKNEKQNPPMRIVA